MERDVTGVRFAERPKHRDPASSRGRRRLPGHSGLADARWSNHGHDTTAATDGAVDDGVQRRHLPAPADQARLRASDEAIALAYPQQSARAHRFLGALDVQPLRLSEHHGVLDEARG